MADGDFPVAAAAPQGRSEGRPLLLRGAGFQRQRLHSPVGGAPEWPLEACPHAVEQVRPPLSRNEINPA